MFLLYINDICDDVTSTIRLFADDCLIYRVVKTVHDSCKLQCDLNSISDWAQRWQMKFNVKKCKLVRCYCIKSPIIRDYTLYGQSLESKTEHLYLGVILHHASSWNSHVNKATGKATKMLNLVRRNFSKCSSKVKSTAYTSLVCPHLEYASCVWDPYQINQIHSLEKVQRRAACWVTSDYGRESSVLAMIQHLG